MPDHSALPLDAYEAAQTAPADALVKVWRACEDGPSGLNLPECLSYALGLAAKQLGLVTSPSLDTESSGFDYATTEAAGAGLVRHRPGSWEAQHVTALVYPVDLIENGR